MPFTPHALSGATGGDPIVVAATTTPGTAIHTVPATAGVFDRIRLYAFNSDTVPRTLVLELGGTAAGNQFSIELPPASAGWVEIYNLKKETSFTIAAFCATANVIRIDGDVTRYTP